VLGSVDGRGGKIHLLVRRTVNGVRHELLHLRRADVVPTAQGVAQVAQSAVSTAGQQGNGGTPAESKCPLVSQATPGSGPNVGGSAPPGPPPPAPVAQQNDLQGNGLQQLGPPGPLNGGTATPSLGPWTPCYTCRNTISWSTGSGPWVCTLCHPPDDGLAKWRWDSIKLLCTSWDPEPPIPPADESTAKGGSDGS
jgi:hypothetical protein